MGIITRFSSIMESNINALLDKLEDPSKAVDQTLRKLNSDYVKVKKETASIMAEERRYERDVVALTTEIENYEKAIKASLLAGNEDDARLLVFKKNDKLGELEVAHHSLSIAKSNSQKMKVMHDKLASDIDTLNKRRQLVKSQVAMAEAQKRINGVSSSINGLSNLNDFKRMEIKAQRMLDTAMAEADLNVPNDNIDNLLDKYNGINEDQVDDEISRLKSELGLE